MSREAMKLALEALENSIDLVSQEARNAEELYGKYPTRLARIQGLVAFEVAHEKAITALREALAEQPAQQEQNRQIDQLIQERDHRDEIIDKLCDAVLGPDRYEWSSQYFFEDAVREVEERMAEQPAQQEPVASIFISGIGEREFDDWGHDLPVGRNLLYTSPPPQRKPLTDEQIDAAVKAWFENDIVAGRQPFAKRMRAAIEAAHGIGEKK